MLLEELIPLRSAFTWDDFYRFTTNNSIGRKIYQPYLNEYQDAGKCIGALADRIGNYCPGNYWRIMYEYNLTDPEYYAAVEAIVDDIMAQRPNMADEEPREYWEFIIHNCYRVAKEAFGKPE